MLDGTLKSYGKRRGYARSQSHRAILYEAAFRRLQYARMNMGLQPDLSGFVSRSPFALAAGDGLP